MRIALLASLAVAALGALAGLAWACTPQQYISAVRPASAGAGTPVVVEGQATSPGLVQILWDGPSGQKIGEGIAGPDGRFSVMAQIPSTASQDIYSIVAFSGSQQGLHGEAPAGLARSVFEVTGEVPGSAQPDSSSTAQTIDNATSDLWGAFSSDSAVLDPVGLESESGQAGPNQMLTTGIGLLGIGIAGATLAMGVVSRRKRETAATRE